METIQTANYSLNYQYTNDSIAKPLEVAVYVNTNSSPKGLSLTIPDSFLHSSSSIDKNTSQTQRGRHDQLVKGGSKAPSYHDKLLLKIKAVVMEQLDNNSFTIDDLAYAQNMSVSSLKRAIKKVSGLSPGKFIREIRLVHANNLLETKKYATVLEVVYAVGFENASHFTKLYLERFGKRPSEYL